MSTLKQPWLSVIIPTYNGENYLPLALDSIAIQQDTDIECIVVDDGSTDATHTILGDYQKKLPLKILLRERLGNWVVNTNLALSHATGRYVCFLHQDDIWLPGRLDKMKWLIEKHPEATLFLTPSYYLDTCGDVLGVWRCPLPPYPAVIKPGMLIETLLIQNFISIPAPVFRRDASLRVHGMDETAWYTADWDFWLKIAQQGDTIYYPTPLSGFRVHSMSQTVMRSSYLHDFRKQLETVFKRHFETWKNTKDHKKRINRVGLFSIEVNVNLASLIHKHQSTSLKLIFNFLLLGPIGWRLYLNNSRIWERVTARVKAQLRTNRRRVGS